MTRFVGSLLLLMSLAAPVRAANAAPSSAPSSTPGSVSGVPTPADIEAQAERLAGALDGVLRNCPAAYAAVGTPGKRCLGVTGDVDTVRAQLSGALDGELYGVWRSRDDQRTVFNWIRVPSGTVYLRVAADSANPARSLIYLDAPTVQASELNAAGTTGASTPSAAQPPSAQTRPAPSKPRPTTTVTTPSTAQTGGVTITRPARSLAPLPFTRTLELRSPRLSGPDVLAAQNRLIALTLGSGPGKGDGWYGPNTAKAVRDFQSANGLGATGKVDKATWDALFSSEAKRFKAGK
jgi:Putative peptidoglycan binding domain